MVLYCRGVHNDPNYVHPDSFPVAQLLLFDKSYEFHHFAVWLNLGHVFLYGQLLAAEQTRLLAFVDVERGESVDKHVCATVMVVPLNDNIGQSGRPFFFLRLHFDCNGTEVVGVDQDVVVVARFKGESVRDDVLLRKVEGAHGPFLVAFKLGDWITVTVLHTVPYISWEQAEHLKELLSDFLHVIGLIFFVVIPHLFKAVVGTLLYFMRAIHRLFLTHRPVKVDVLLLQG